MSKVKAPKASKISKVMIVSVVIVIIIIIAVVVYLVMSNSKSNSVVPIPFKSIKLYLPQQGTLNISELEIMDIKGDKVEITPEMIQMSSIVPKSSDTIPILLPLTNLVDNNVNTYVQTIDGNNQFIKINLKDNQTISSVIIKNRIVVAWATAKERIIGAKLNLEPVDAEITIDDVEITKAKDVYTFKFDNSTRVLSCDDC